MMQIYPGPIPPEMPDNFPGQVVEAEQRFYVAKAVNLVQRDLDCTGPEAIAAICRDWLELRGVDILSENPLAHSTPADFRPSLLDLIKKLF